MLGRNFLRAFNFNLLQYSENINLVDSSNSIGIAFFEKYKEVFDGTLGTFNLGRVKLECLSNAKPIYCKPRPVPLAWKRQIEKQLNDLVRQKVLTPIDNSEWGTALVLILKPNGQLRIFGDYKTTVNKFLVDINYPLPRIEELFAELQGGQLFTKLDMSNAYKQLSLDENSQKLCAWSTHIGTFLVNRLPFGVKPASAIFQRIMENLFRNIQGVVVYMDDIVVTGITWEKRRENLHLVL